MAIELEIIEIGSAAGVLLPDELLAHMKVGPGDRSTRAKRPAAYC